MEGRVGWCRVRESWVADSTHIHIFHTRSVDGPTGRLETDTEPLSRDSEKRYWAVDICVQYCSIGMGWMVDVGAQRCQSIAMCWGYQWLGVDHSAC